MHYVIDETFLFLSFHCDPQSVSQGSGLLDGTMTRVMVSFGARQTRHGTVQITTGSVAQDRTMTTRNCLFATADIVKTTLLVLRHVSSCWRTSATWEHAHVIAGRERVIIVIN